MEDFSEREAMKLRQEVHDKWFEKFGKIDIDNMDDDDIIDYCIQTMRYSDNELIELSKKEKEEKEIFLIDLYLSMKIAILEDIKKLPENIQNDIINAYFKAIKIDGFINFHKSCRLGIFK